MGLLALHGLAAAQSPPAPTIRRYDLRFLVAPEQVWIPPLLGTPIGELSEPRSGSATDIPDKAVDPEWLLSFLRDVLGAHFSDPADGPRLDWQDGVLVAGGDENMHKQLGALLEQFRQFFLEQVVLELHVLPGTAATTGAGVLRREEAERLLLAAGPHPLFVTPARVGSIPALQSVTAESYLKDYEVEVAQASNIPDPKVDVLRVGEAWRVGVARVRDGRLWVTLSGDHAEQLADPEARELRGLDFKDPAKSSIVQLTRIAVLWQDAQALLADGEALLCGSNAEHGGVVCLRVRRPQVVAAPSGDGWCLTPVAELVGTIPHRRAPTDLALTTPGEDAAGRRPAADGESQPRLLTAEALEASLRECFRGEEARSIQWVPPGTTLLVRAPPAELKAIDDRLSVLAKDATRQVTFELRFGKIAASDVPAILSERTDVGELAARLPHICLTAAVLQERIAMSVGKQIAYVRDYEVEIAQDAAIANPVVDVLFAGIGLNARVLPLPNGQFRVDLDCGFSELDGDIETFDPKHGMIGTIDVPKMHELHFAVAPLVDDNRWTLAYVAPIQDTPQHLVVVVRVRG